MKKHVLLIDDDHEELQLLGMVMNHFGLAINCSWAGSYNQAIEMLEHLQPDCILLDINMPRVGGMACLARLKKQPLTSHIPVILYSTYIDGPTRDKAMGLGALSVLEKPSGPHDFRGVAAEIHRAFLEPKAKVKLVA